MALEINTRCDKDGSMGFLCFMDGISMNSCRYHWIAFVFFDIDTEFYRTKAQDIVHCFGRE